MAWKKVYQNRLKKFADHLMTGKLGHQVFNFAHLNSFKTKSIPYKCGYAGCAMGECPVIFKQWEFNEVADPVLKGIDNSTESVVIFFGLNYNETDHLFYSHSQNIEKYGGRHLEEEATRKQVARNIRAFIKIKAGK